MFLWAAVEFGRGGGIVPQPLFALMLKDSLCAGCFTRCSSWWHFPLSSQVASALRLRRSQRSSRDGRRELPPRRARSDSGWYGPPARRHHPVPAPPQEPRPGRINAEMSSVLASIVRPPAPRTSVSGHGAMLWPMPRLVQGGDRNPHGRRTRDDGFDCRAEPSPGRRAGTTEMPWP